MTLEDQVIGISFAASAVLLFFWAVPRYALCHVGPGKPPPLPVGRVPTRGFGLIDALGVSLFFGIYTSAWVATKGEPPVDLESLGEKVKYLPYMMVGQLVIQATTIVMIVGLLFWRMNVVEAFGLRWRLWPLLFLIGPAGLCLMLVVGMGLQAVGYNAWMIELAGGNAEQAQQDIVRLFNELDNPITLGLMAAVACLGAPLAEEFVFRGYIYGAVKRFAGVPVAVLFSALFFAAVHTNMAVLLPLFVLGVILAVSYEVTGSLWVPIAIHFCFNSFSTGMMLLMKIPAVQKLMEEAAANEALIRSW